MSKKIDYQNLSSNIIKNSEVTTEDMDETHLTKFFRKTKRKIFGSTFKLCLVVIIIFLLVIFRIRSSSLSSIPNTIMSTTTSVKPTDFYSNAPNIIFHKTHKTGSSSIQNIMYRLGLKHRMPILWGKHGGTGIGYPASFNDAKQEVDIFTTSSPILVRNCDIQCLTEDYNCNQDTSFVECNTA